MSERYDFKCDVCGKECTIFDVGLLASLDEECNTLIEMQTICKVCRDKMIKEKLQKKDVIPNHRLEDYEWIRKNFNFDDFLNLLIESKIQQP